MTRKWQIRIEDDTDNLVECLCFDSLAVAQEHYNRMLEPEEDMSTYYLELIEVVRQDTVKTKEAAR